MNWRLLSRRGLVRSGLAGLASLATVRAIAQTADGQDRGLGGTGVAPTDRGDEDRGIGGTGVVGTIRRFGSIVVNDLRIGYPPNVVVTIDGMPATRGDLRLGHVVDTVARKHRGRLSTRHIAVSHEVIGPIEEIGARNLRVMGQYVALAEVGDASEWQKDEIVAVSGLRRPDDVIVASLIERRYPSPLRVAGTVRRDREGSLRIGRLRLASARMLPVGKRVALAGRLADGSFEVASVANPALTFLAERPDRLSIETFVERGADGAHLSSGFDIAGAVPTRTIPANRVVRAILSAHVDSAGAFHLDGVRMVGQLHDRGSGHAAGHAPGSGGPPGRAGPGHGAGSGPGGSGGEGSGDGHGGGSGGRGSGRH